MDFTANLQAQGRGYCGAAKPASLLLAGTCATCATHEWHSHKAHVIGSKATDAKQKSSGVLTIVLPTVLDVVACEMVGSTLMVCVPFIHMNWQDVGMVPLVVRVAEKLGSRPYRIMGLNAPVGMETLFAVMEVDTTVCAWLLPTCMGASK